ncbi:GNAT family N-acetyltransferase [Nocardia vinacea]|uniref:GNAT family N-acetyltransferase n=1 Tax=Nocardia vinacea TaxID=96468 RepID=UPI0033FCA42F
MTELLFAAVGGDRSRLPAVVRRYIDTPAADLIAARIDDALVAVVGYEIRRNQVTLLHIAATESHRNRGIGSHLLTAIRSRHPALSIVAETDNTSLGFYLARGFTAESLGEKYPGVERFRVELAPTINQDQK